MKPRLLHPAILLISGTAIAYELALMRIFSIAQWHHFAYMVISIAMLGFGAAGTLLMMRGAEARGRDAGMLRLCALTFAVSVPACYDLSQRVPFETFRLVVEPVQLLHLLMLYVSLAIPFFFASACVVLAFLLERERVGRVYFFNLVGSGAGAGVAVAAMYAMPPEELPYLLAVPAGLAFALLMTGSLRDLLRAFASLAALCLVVLSGGRQPIRISEYKGLSYALRYPDAAVVAQVQSPLSWIVAIRSERIRETPGQISNYPMEELGRLPEQVGLFFDAGGVSVINRGGSPERFAYLDYVTAALPYQFLASPRALVIGAGGGTDILMALSHGADHVTAVEVDPRVIPLIRKYFAEFSDGLYDRPDVSPVTAEGRGYLQSHDQKYDLVQIALLDSFNAAAAGVHALSESHLYTREAMAAYMEHLSPGGVLAVTRWLKTPARDAVKLFATMVEACEEIGIAEPAEHLAFIRSWNTGTILASRSPLTAEQIGRIRRFCDARGFDLCHLPGLEARDVNRYTILAQPIYYQSAQRILSPEREAFYDDYLFYVRPATDDRPYFFRFFKWTSLRRLLSGMGVEWVPFVEWGYLALVATVLQAVAASLVFILLPLAACRGQGEGTGLKRWVLLYFGVLGVGYMFLEIAFIQKFMLFLSYPIYAVAVVLSAFLVFSGVGSYWADRLRRRSPGLVRNAVVAIAAVSVLYIAILPRLFAAWAGWSDGWRILASLVLLAPLACFMGIPFPCGLQLVSDRHPGLVPWAWGVNGLCSVIGAGVAVLVAIHAGFRALVMAAVIVYVVGVFGFHRLMRGGTS